MGDIQNTPYNELVTNCRHGVFCCLSKDRFMSGGLKELGECGENEVKLFSALISEGDTVFDVGANIGVHAVPLARKVGNRGRVIAIEPERVCYLNLCANAAINSLYGLYPYNAAASDSPGVIRLAPLDPWGCDNAGIYSVIKAQSSIGIPVPVLTLDSFCARPSFIKIDVEGMEAHVLRGAVKTITLAQPYVYCECFSAVEYAAQMEILGPLGYTGYTFYGWLYSDDNWRGYAVNNFADIFSINVLYIPSGKQVPVGFGLEDRKGIDGMWRSQVSHAKVNVSGYDVPLIGIPEDATTQECDRCHKRFLISDLRMAPSGSAFYCVGCYLAEERKEVMWK